MATEPFSDDELKTLRERCDMDEQSPAHNVVEARWFATIDALRARLRDAETVIDHARGFFKSYETERALARYDERWKPKTP